MTEHIRVGALIETGDARPSIAASHGYSNKRAARSATAGYEKGGLRPCRNPPLLPIGSRDCRPRTDQPVAQKCVMTPSDGRSECALPNVLISARIRKPALLVMPPRPMSFGPNSVPIP